MYSPSSIVHCKYQQGSLSPADPWPNCWRGTDPS